MDSKKVLKKVGGIALTILGAIVLKMLDNKEPAKYSEEWFNTISDEEFDAEREPVRKKARENGGDLDADKLLRRFDREEAQRLNEKYEKENPNWQPIHREHGRYLPNDE